MNFSITDRVNPNSNFSKIFTVNKLIGFFVDLISFLSVINAFLDFYTLVCYIYLVILFSKAYRKDHHG